MRSFKNLLFFAGLSFCLSQANAQSYQQVVQTSGSGDKVFLEINLRNLQQSMDSIFSNLTGLSSSSSSVSWGDVLQNGSNPGMNINFNSYDIQGLGNLTATGTLNADSLTLNKDADITGSLSVTDVVDFGDSLSVTGYVLFSDSLQVVKAVTIGETLFVTGVTSLGDSLHVSGNVDLDQLFNVDGAATFGSTMVVTGETTLNDSLHVNSGANITGTLEVDGETTLNDSLHVNSSADINVNLNVDGTISSGGGTASGSRSVARGYNAVASGAHAIALDSLSTAAGMSSKAIGRESQANTSDAVALGFNSQAGSELAWSSSFRGWHAMALGANSEANGTHSYTFGQSSFVDSSSTNSYAMGYLSNVDVNSSFSYAIGAYSKVQGNASTGSTGSLALGYQSEIGTTGPTPSSFAIAFGQGSNASNVSAMAFGQASKATKWHAFAFGQNATASSSHAMSFGQGSTASADQAITFGRNSTASGPHSMTFGEQSSASGYSSRAFGFQSDASGSSAFALGYSSTASGYQAFAFGESSKAITGHAMAMGDRSEANAYNSLALGYKAKTTGSQSFVHAAESEANALHEVVLGSYSDNSPFASADASNWIETDPLLIVGNGSGTTDRSNAFVIRKDGAAMFSDSLHVAGHVTLGDQLTVTGVTTLNDSLHVNSSADISGTLEVTGETTLNDILHAAAAVDIEGNLRVNNVSQLTGDELSLSSDDYTMTLGDDIFELRHDDDEDYFLIDDAGSDDYFIWLDDADIGSSDNMMVLQADDGLRIAVDDDRNDAGIEMHNENDIMVIYADSIYSPVEDAYFLQIDHDETGGIHPIFGGQEHIYMTDDLGGNYSMMKHFITEDERNGTGNFLGIWGSEDVSLSAGDDAGLELSNYFNAAVLYGDSVVVKGDAFLQDDLQVDGDANITGNLVVGTTNVNNALADIIPFNHYEAWIQHSSIIGGITASTTSAQMFVDSTSTQSVDPESIYGLSGGDVTIQSSGFYEIQGYVFGNRTTAGSGYVTASVSLGSGAPLPQCTATEEWTQTINSSVRTNCRIRVFQGQTIRLSVVEQSFGTSNITDAGIVLKKVANTLSPG